MAMLLLLFAAFISCLNAKSSGYGGIPMACMQNFKDFAFCDTSLSITDRVNKLISMLTLEEKAMLLTARQSPFNAIPRLGIPEYDWGTNCIHSAQTRCGSSCATVFPEPNALGATWNRTLVTNMATAIGLELRALWLQGMGENHPSNLPHLGLDCWSPTINIGRDPRWGRMMEIPSEDPYWNGEYGKAYTLGLQNGSKQSPYHDDQYYLAVVTLKHFAAYSLEEYGDNITRHNFNAVISPYMLSDTYLPAWKKSIVEGGAKGVMCSYNAVNGVPTCASPFLLNETLRQKWGFQGYVTSDSGAINDIFKDHHYTSSLEDAAVKGLSAGCDMDSYLGLGMGGWSGDFGTSSPYQVSIPSIVNESKLDESFIDRAVFNTMRLRFELGLFDGNYEEQTYFNIPGSVINSKEHRELNLFAARSAQTLLKNTNRMLPFADGEKEHTFAVIGPHFNASADLLLQGAYTGEVCQDGTFDCVPGILQRMEKYVDSKNILVSAGCKDVKCALTTGFEEAKRTAQKASHILLIMGINHEIEKEGNNGDRKDISLPGHQQELVKEICALQKPTVLILIGGGVLAIDELKEQCPAILYSWYPGFRGAEAIVDVVFGAFNPGGKMAVTMYHSNFTEESDYLEYDLTAGNGKTYKYWKGTPALFEFGYGLSYTTFEMKKNEGCSSPTFCVDITNKGPVAGHETVFVFVYPPRNISSSEPASKMVRFLLEFEKFYLEKGETATFRFEVDKNRDFTMYDVHGDPTVFPGQYRLEFSNGADQMLSELITV